MGYSGSPDEVRVIVAAEVDRAIAAFHEAAGAVGGATRQMSGHLEEMGDISERVQRKMEHSATAIGYSLGALATSSGSATERIAHALTGLAFAINPIAGGIVLALGSIVAQLENMGDTAEKQSERAGAALDKYTKKALQAALAGAQAYASALYSHIQNATDQDGSTNATPSIISGTLRKNYAAALEKVNLLTAALANLNRDEGRSAHEKHLKEIEDAAKAAAAALKRLNAEIEKGKVDAATRVAAYGGATAADELASKSLEEYSKAQAKAAGEATKAASDEQLRAIMFGLDQMLDQLHKSEDETKKTQEEIKKGWVETFDAIPQAAQRAFQDVIHSGQSMKAFWRFLVQEMAASMIEAAWHGLAAWTAAELAKRGITRSSVLERVALESWGALQTIAIVTWEAAKFIVIKAVEGAAAAWKSVADIPKVGWILGPIVAAGTLAGILALGSRLHSAAGGFDIPAGMNPVTQLHAQEMVLPREYADVIRGLSRGGGGGGDTYNIYTYDSQDLERFLRRNAGAVARAAQAGAKSGALDSGVGRVPRRV